MAILRGTHEWLNIATVNERAIVNEPAIANDTAIANGPVIERDSRYILLPAWLYLDIFSRQDLTCSIEAAIGKKAAANQPADRTHRQSISMLRKINPS